MNALHSVARAGGKITLALVVLGCSLVGGTVLAQEIIAGLTLSIQVNGASVSLSWNSSPGNSYQVQSRTSLSTGNWATVETLIAVESCTSWVDPSPLASTRFYRLLLPGGEIALLEPPNPPPATPEASPMSDDYSLGRYEAGLYLFSGEFHFSVEDLRIRGRGLDFVWARKYRSRAGPNTSQGNGWDSSYNIRIQRCGQNIQVSDGNTRRDVFVLQTNGTYAVRQFFREGSFGTNGTFTLRFADTGTWEFLPLDGSAQQGKISRITDRNGNSLSFAYDGLGRLITVTDTLSRNVSIAYNADGFIQSVTDFTGRQVTYAYYQNADAGGAFGDLKSVTSPAVTGTPNANDFPAGKTTLYTYSKGFADGRLNHNLLTITDPKGQTWLQNFYSGNQNPAAYDFDRVLSQAQGNSNDLIMLHYVSQAPGASNNFAVTKAILNDRVGNVREYSYDAGNRRVVQREFTGRAVPGQTTTEIANRPINPLRTNDPPYFETQYEWNTDSLLTRVTQPNGNSIENTYELALDPNAARRSRGNLRVRRQLPGPLGGDQTEIVELYEYEVNLGGCGCGFNFVKKHTDARTNVTMHSYDARGNRTNTMHRIPAITEQWEYNAFGQMTAHVLPDNGSGHRRRDTLSYYSVGPQTGYLQQQVVDAGGFNLTTTYEYDAVGNVVRLVDARGNDMLHAINQLNQVVRESSRAVITPNGPVRYEQDLYYDANDNVVRADVQNIDEQGVLDPNTHFTTTYDYEILNRLVRTTQEIDPIDNVVTEYVYDANRNRTLERFGEATAGNDPFNAVQSWYDERDLLFRQTRAPGSPDQSTTQFDYDGNRSLSETSHGLESAPRNALYTYDGYDRRVTTTDAMGNVTTARYDANGNVVTNRVDGQLMDVPGGTGNTNLSATTYAYDAMDRLIRQDRAFFDTETHAPIGDGQSTTETFYSDHSQVIRVLDDHNHQTLTEYDTANRRRVVTDAKTNTVSYNYDANGNVITNTAVDKSDLGNPDQTFVTQYAYDTLDRLIQTVDNVSNTSRDAYDSRNNRVRYTDARNNETRYEYDGLNRLVRTLRDMDTNSVFTDAVDIVTSQTWDDSSRLTSQTDDNTNTTAYAYDSLDRAVTTDYADCTTNQTAYDVHDNATQTADANNSIVNYAYDLLNRVTSKTIAPGPGVSAGTTFENYQYDGLSRLVRAQDNDSLVTRGSASTSGYDSLSRVLRETQRVIPGGLTRTVTNEYDGEGNQIRLVYPGGRAIIRIYDVLDRPLLVNDDPPGPNPPIATYAYIGPFRVEQRDYPKLNPAETIRFTPLYDGVRRIIGTIHDRNPLGLTTVIDHRFYDWDAIHNKIGMHRPIPPPPEDRFYTYDAANRLIRSQIMVGGPPSFIDYVLDGVGNRQQVIGGPDAGPYTMDPTLCEPGDFQMNQYTTMPFDSRTNDANGNLTGTFSVPRNFTYDYRNQLVNFFDAGTGQTTAYKYDCFGRRSEKNVGGTITRFYYDGWQEIEEQNAANATVATYVWGLGLDELLMMTRNGQPRYFHADDLGSIVKVTDAAANILESYSYGDYGKPSFFDQFGNPIGQSFIANPYLFTGRRWDHETGFYDYRTRYLDSYAGRFIVRDTIGIWGDCVNLGNAYSYVGNNPASRIDPYGEDSPGCDGVPDVVESDCVLRCCAKHDKCYDDNKCTQASWLPGQGSKKCKQCNAAVVLCALSCLTTLGQLADWWIGGPRYYCAVDHVFFDDPKSRHMKHSTDTHTSAPTPTSTSTPGIPSRGPSGQAPCATGQGPPFSTLESYRPWVSMRAVTPHDLLMSNLSVYEDLRLRWERVRQSEGYGPELNELDEDMNRVARRGGDLGRDLIRSGGR